MSAYKKLKLADPALEACLDTHEIEEHRSSDVNVIVGSLHRHGYECDRRRAILAWEAYSGASGLTATLFAGRGKFWAELPVRGDALEVASAIVSALVERARPFLVVDVPKHVRLDAVGVPQATAAGFAKHAVTAIVETLPAEVKPHLAVCVLVFGEDEGGAFTVYAANAKRDAMVKALEEFLERLKAGNGSTSRRVPS